MLVYMHDSMWSPREPFVPLFGGTRGLCWYIKIHVTLHALLNPKHAKIEIEFFGSTCNIDNWFLLIKGSYIFIGRHKENFLATIQCPLLIIPALALKAQSRNTTIINNSSNWAKKFEKLPFYHFFVKFYSRHACKTNVRYVHLHAPNIKTSYPNGLLPLDSSLLIRGQLNPSRYFDLKPDSRKERLLYIKSLASKPFARHGLGI